MKAIKSKNTKMEVKLAKMLWSKGFRFRRNSPYVPGKPDFSLKKYKLAIFVDSEFFHGKNWDKEKFRIKSNRDFWWKKIEGNISRDRYVNLTLIKAGWKVIRFWSKEVQKKPEFCLTKVEKEIQKLANAKILPGKRKVEN